LFFIKGNAPKELSFLFQVERHKHVAAFGTKSGTVQYHVKPSFTNQMLRKHLRWSIAFFLLAFRREGPIVKIECFPVKLPGFAPKRL